MGASYKYVAPNSENARRWNDLRQLRAQGGAETLGDARGDQGHGDLVNASAIVEYDADLVTPETLANAVRQLGYEVAA